MSLVNCKVEFIRPKYKNLEEWVNDSNNAYIGRGGVVFVNKQRFPKEASIWANPFKVGNKEGQYTREEAIRLYEVHVRKLIQDPEKKAELMKLKGKNLGCWCAPEPCHGNILLKLIQEG